jgi:hypothetical protein
MAQSDTEDAGSVHLTFDADCTAATTTTVVIADDPPEYSARDFSTSNDGDQQPPPPPYPIPQEHPPPYQTPPWNHSHRSFQYNPSQPDRLTVGLRSGQPQIRIIHQSSNQPFLKLLLACAVFWLCGFLFGAIAFILASEW